MLLSYLTLTQSWFNVANAIFEADWSISTEWFFYWAFVPLTLWMPHFRHPMRALLIFAASAFVGLVVILTYCQTPITAVASAWFSHERVSFPPYDWNTHSSWINYHAPLIRLPEFVLRMLAAQVYAAGSFITTPFRANLVVGLCLAWILTVMLTPVSGTWFLLPLAANFISAPAIVLIMIFATQDNWPGRFLGSPPMVFVGTISYSIYIWCWSAFSLVGNFASEQPSALAYFNSCIRFAMCVLFTMVFAYGCYLLIENPSRKWLRNRLGSASA